MFEDYIVFKQEMVNMFGDLGKEQRFVTILIGLKQDKLVTTYIARFRQLLSKIG